MKSPRIGYAAVLLAVGIMLTGCTNSGMIRIPFLKFPIERTYNASFDRTWKAAVQAMKGYELVVEDDESGYLISDYIKGESDTYRYRDDKDGKEKPCRCEFSIHAVVEEIDKQRTKVHIDLYEKTLFMYPDAGPTWELTKSSTLREKKILDKIAEILSKG
ncbi:MAG: hypothetical protein GXP25_20490 [Planctomycetes bacterium]|nr:hypothetical protein [Planctomycetota bacterium]